MIYGHFVNLNRRTASDKLLRNKAFNIAKNLKYDGYQRGLSSMVYKMLIQKPLKENLKIRISQTKSQLQNYTNQLLETLRKGKYTHLLQTLFGEHRSSRYAIDK